VDDVSGEDRGLAEGRDEKRQLTESTNMRSRGWQGVRVKEKKAVKMGQQRSQEMEKHKIIT